MPQKIKYLSYIEETKKHHPILEKEAKSSIKRAIIKSHKRSVAVTYMEGYEIVKVGPKGEKSVIGTVKNNIRKVKVGEKTKL